MDREQVQTVLQSVVASKNLDVLVAMTKQSEGRKGIVFCARCSHGIAVAAVLAKHFASMPAELPMKLAQSPVFQAQGVHRSGSQWKQNTETCNGLQPMMIWGSVGALVTRKTVLPVVEAALFTMHLPDRPHL